jgi:protein-S-isoprenylcysteine O-methyltransferase Ste14
MRERETSVVSTKLSRGTWIVFALLGAMLLASMIGFWLALTYGQLPKISVHGWIAMSIGIVMSLVIGCGLMWLSFYSSRNGFDDRADPGKFHAQKDVNRP